MPAKPMFSGSPWALLERWQKRWVVGKPAGRERKGAGRQARQLTTWHAQNRALRAARRPGRWLLLVFRYVLLECVRDRVYAI